MKTFFSILYIPLNASLNEKVSVGMIMSNGEENIFRFSNTKFNLLKGLIPNQNYTLLKSYLRSLDYGINNEIDNDFKLRIPNDTNSKWINESYISYLSRYSNNLVSFSDSKVIDIDLNKSNFKKLFNKFIFEYENDEVAVLKDNDVVSEIKKILYPKIENRVNIDVTITPQKFKELVAPVEVNFIGINGKVVAGQSIDFSKKLYNLENDLTKFISLTKAVDYQYTKGTYYVIGQEPEKQNYKNHNTWRNVKDSHLVKYVDISETEIIEEYIEKHHVQPFFTE